MSLLGSFLSGRGTGGPWKPTAGASVMRFSCIGLRIDGRMRHVYPLDCPIEHAISRPLGSWCLLLTFAATDDEEADFSWMSFTIPWHRQAALDLETLRRDGFALVACEGGPMEAFQLLGAMLGRRVGARVFDPEGR